nr:iron ABC transporter permease [Pseudovibrio flavus]
MILAFFTSVVLGPASIDVREGLMGLVGVGPEPVVVVMQEIRLPRAILGVLIGMTLGLSGAVLQGYLRNPLAEPGLVGVSASASLGAVIAIYSGLATLFPMALPLLALAGAAVSGVLVQMLSGKGQALTLILAGVAISSIASALTSLALNMSSNPFAAMEIVFWMLGSLEDRSMEHIKLAVPFMVVGWLMLASVGKDLDLLTLGEDTAVSMGVNMKRLSFTVITGVAASVGAATAVAGAIGFVGLFVPHVMRPLVGNQPSKLLFPSALAGGILLSLADVGVRVITPDSNLKLGVVTALIGAPFFLWLVLSTGRRELQWR